MKARAIVGLLFAASKVTVELGATSDPCHRIEAHVVVPFCIRYGQTLKEVEVVPFG
jgi:hypothetical protein